jgi:hypothetical protein
MGQQDKGLPKHVWSEFEAYLKCGRLEYGFLRVRCEDCHHEHLVAFSWPLLRIPMRPRHLCILHVITQRVLIVVCQTERQCAANGKKRGEWQKTWRMAQSAALLVGDVLPHEPIRQWVFNFSFQLSFCLPAIPTSWEKYWVLCIAHLPPISLKKQATTKRRHKLER